MGLYLFKFFNSMLMKRIVCLIFLLFEVQGFAQKHLDLNDLSGFKPQAGNWQIVGAILVNPTVDVHEIKTEEPKTKKRRKRHNEVQFPQPIMFESGTGILLNINDSDKKDMLQTNWEHGDIILELEVMLPKGSNSGIYFQGRYELQLKDSWGVLNPKVSDMGGIHNNWETTPNEIFRGIPPLSNASKAPGLWQSLRVHFQAPKFNVEGEKIANARFVFVELNGVAIHTNIEVPNYTGSPIEKNEVPKGPLAIQGDHGPVAFRNIRYSLMEPSQVFVDSLKYKTYKGEFEGLEELSEAKVVSEGTSNLIDVHLVGEEDHYGIQYTGKLNIPKEDVYNLSVSYSGGISLDINGVSLVKQNSSNRVETLTKKITLKEGKHEFLLTNIKSAPWRSPKLGFSVSSATTYPKEFNTYNSSPPEVSNIAPIFVKPDVNPRLLRAFVSFKGDGDRLSHTIGVGTPNGVNYIYDLGSGNLVAVWRGQFVDATPMWHERGDGSFKPMGAVQWTFLNQSIAQLPDLNTAFPKTGEYPDFVPKGYVIDETNQLPVFKHIYKNVTIENMIQPNNSNTHITREIRFSNGGMENWYCKLASGEIKKIPDGSYAINGQYYIKVLSHQIPITRDVNGENELVIPVDGDVIKYELIW